MSGFSAQAQEILGNPGFIAKDILKLPAVSKLSNTNFEFEDTWGVYADIVTQAMDAVYEVYVGSSHNSRGLRERLLQHQRFGDISIEVLEARAQASLERFEARQAALIAAGEAPMQDRRQSLVVSTYYKYACANGRTMNHRVLCEFPKEKKFLGYINLVSYRFVNRLLIY